MERNFSSNQLSIEMTAIYIHIKHIGISCISEIISCVSKQVYV